MLRKRSNKGNVEYLVKQKNFNESKNSWEPAENLNNAKELVAEFERSLSIVGIHLTSL